MGRRVRQTHLSKMTINLHSSSLVVVLFLLSCLFYKFYKYFYINKFLININNILKFSFKYIKNKKEEILQLIFIIKVVFAAISTLI